MGYRSDVAIALLKEDYPKFLKMYSDLRNNDFIEDFSPDKVEEIQDTIIIHLNDVKWYDWAYEDVKAVMRILHEEEFPYEFLRIGEEHDDIDSEQFEEDALGAHLEVCTSINVWW